MHPCCAVERLSEDEWKKAQKGASNLKYEEREFYAVIVGARNGSSMAATYSVTDLSMTISHDVKKGIS